MKVSVRELKGNLSNYLKHAAAGEEVTVTSRRRPIARLVPPAAQLTDRELSPAEVRRRLAAMPGIILPSGRFTRMQLDSICRNTRRARQKASPERHQRHRFGPGQATL